MAGNETNTEIIGQFRKHDSDTGSSEVQVALMTARINQITDHLREHKKDHASRRGLMQLVGKRTALLRYLRREDERRYQDVIAKLGLRK